MKYVEGIDEENMDRFLAALRSGAYKQGTGNLAYDNGSGMKHCCLGVGSELAFQDGAVSRIVNDGSVKFGNSYQLASEALLDWLGIPEVNRINIYGDSWNIKFFKSTQYNSFHDHYTTATDLNDGERLSFNSIADVFEAEFLSE